MALGERFRGTGSSGVARFLAQHQACDAGFDVTREQGPGSGQLRITCKGCGQTVEYRAADAAQFGGPGGVPPDNGRAPAAAPASPAPDPPATVPEAEVAATGDLPPQRAMPRAAVHRPAPPSRRGFPLTNALIAAVILGGIALIVVGVIRSSGGSDQSESTTAGDGVQEPPQAEPEKPATTAPAVPRAPARPAPAALRRKSFAGRFSIGVPRGWDQRPSEGGVALLADGGAAQVEVFSENPARSPGELADLTRGFLAERHPGARVSRPRPARFGGERALRIDSRYGGGHETAAVLSSGGVSYLVIVRTDETAGPELVQLADSSFLSFRPG